MQRWIKSVFLSVLDGFGIGISYFTLDNMKLMCMIARMTTRKKHQRTTEEEQAEIVCLYREGFPNVTMDQVAKQVGLCPKTVSSILRRSKSTFTEIARERGGRHFKRYRNPLPQKIKDKMEEIAEDVGKQKIRELVTPFGTIKTSSQLSITLDSDRMEIEFLTE